MKRSTAIFLQTTIALFGIAVLFFLLWEPQIEGRNAHATLYEIYFKDSFLACAYAASVLFFVALYQAFRLFGDMGRWEVPSQRSLRALRIIRYCALILVGFVLAGLAYLMLVMKGQDDIAGGVAMGGFVASFFVIAATAAALFEKNLQARVELGRSITQHS